MKVGIITFHSAHNYGSMLQAYALKHTIISMGHQCSIINFRTPVQKQMYKVITGRSGLGPVLKDLSHLLFYRKLKEKYRLFEAFIDDLLVNITPPYFTKTEFNSLEELNDAQFDYDAVICGSDQIWKPSIADFSWAYFLPFVKSGKRIAYAPSYGPSKQFSMDFKELFIGHLSKFDAISVREEGTKQVIESLTGMHNIEVVCDPVFLLSKEDWNKLIDSCPIIKKPYILFYTLFADKGMVELVKEVSKQLHLPIVVSNFSNFYDLTAGFKMYLNCGPCEFLNLLQHAEYICTSSFHGTALATLLNKRLISLRGMQDNRIRSVLEKLELQAYTITTIEDVYRVCELPTCDFDKVNRLIEIYKQSGLSYLQKNL